MKKCTKAIIENFSEPCLLFLLLQKPSYGYELKQNLEERCGCQADMGNLYRCLGRLQKDGHIAKTTTVGDETRKAGPARSVYRLTPKGNRLLTEWMAALEETDNTIKQLLVNYKHYEDNQQQ